jgi:hypothetical protein
MKIKTFTIVLILALLSVGFFIFSFVGHNGQHGCFVSSIPGNNCPAIGGIMAIAFHHIAGIQNLMLTVVSYGTFLLSLTVFFIFISFVVLKFLQKAQNLQYFSSKIYSKVLESIFIQKNQLLYWLSLSRKRDPHVF